MATSTLRRAARGSIASIAVIGALFVGAGTAQAALDPAQLRAVTDDYVFSRSLAEFGTIRTQTPYADQLDWSSDGCSNAPDNPFGFTFVRACHRHDFAYRNYKRQGRFTEGNRGQLDLRFKADMYTVCNGNWWCKRTADVYYAAVRQFGGNAASTAEVLSKPAVRQAAMVAAGYEVATG